MKRMLYVVLVVFLMIGLGERNNKVYANELEKEIKVPIEREYKSIKFTMEFEYFEDYQVTVISPDQKAYEAKAESENVITCIINNAKTGEWSVKVTKQESDEKEISPVKISVKGSNQIMAEISKEIVVATDISGLKMYFLDDSFVASWKDTTCGSVNIEISNAKTKQKIDSATITDTYYECPIPEIVEEIEVKVVPSVSSSLAGAENSYTFLVDNNPQVTILFDESDLTKENYSIVTAVLEKPYKLLFSVNGKVVKETNDMGTGEFTFELPLENEFNKIICSVIDEKDNIRTFRKEIACDITPPVLTLNSSFENMETKEDTINIQGRVEEHKNLFINNELIPVASDSSFDFDYILKEGNNEIIVRAMDEAGNETSYTIHVNKIVSSDFSIIGLIKILPLIAAIVCFILMFPKIKMEKRAKKEKKTIPGRKKETETIWEMLDFLVPLIAIYIVLSHVIFLSVTQSGSMEPKLKTGNTVFYNRIAYILKKPSRGDVVVFYSKEFKSYFAKRIIGLPGEHISFHDGFVMVDGQFLDEKDYIEGTIETNSLKEFDVPDNMYFLLGDNRENSNDARFWKNPYISETDIKGEYIGQIDFSLQRDVLQRHYLNYIKID